jgi:Protein of unknown function (DUF3562)
VKRYLLCGRAIAEILPAAATDGFTAGSENSFTPKLNWQIWLAKEPRTLIVSSINLMQQVTLLSTEQESGKTSHLDTAAVDTAIIDTAAVATEIDLLVRKTRMPRELVAKLYTSARTKLEPAARIKTFLPLLIHRQVKDLLREQHRA